MVLDTCSFVCIDSAELSQKKLSEWNPMERDYLAQRNNYGIDNEAAGLALHGYGECVCILPQM